MKLEEPAASALDTLVSLVGDSISRVVYHEIKYESGTPAYVAADHHSLDYGLELQLESGKTVSFIWKWPVSYFLAVLRGDLSPELRGEHAVWDVSSDFRWAGLLKQRIDSACLEWFESDDADGHFPLTAKIVIHPGSAVYITLGIAGEGDDQLAVLFSDDTAQAHGRFFEVSALAKRS